MEIIENSGKAYLVDSETKRVIAAADSAEALLSVVAAGCSCECGGCKKGEHCSECSKVDEVDPSSDSGDEKKSFALGDRVLVFGNVGVIEHLATSVYGDVAGVKMESGLREELLIDGLTHAPVEKQARLSVVEGIQKEYDLYSGFVTEGIQDVRIKLASAQNLHKIASQALQASKDDQEKIKLDLIRVATAVDIHHLQEDARDLEVAESRYLEDRPRYETAIAGETHYHSTEDASWLLESATDMEEQFAAIDWNGFLASEAIGLVDRMAEEYLAEQAVLEEQASLHFANIASGLEGETYDKRLAQFKDFVHTSKTGRLEKIAKTASARTASTEEDDTPFESIFI